MRWFNIQTRILLTVLFALAFIVSYRSIHAQTLVEITKLSPQQVELAGFSLAKSQTVSLTMQTLIDGHRRYADVHANVWILESASRDLVWESNAVFPSKHARSKESFITALELKAGDYEVYFSTYPHHYFYHEHFHIMGSILAHIFDEIDSENDYDDRRTCEHLLLKITGDGKSLSREETRNNISRLREKAVVNFTQMGDEDWKEQYFSVDKPVDVRIYAVGEVRRDDPFDFGWIANLETGQREWQLDYRHSESAGGAQKNRLFNNWITLQPGKYKAVFITDDSHSYDRWNSAPPYDPEFWGLTVCLKNESDLTFVKKTVDDDVKNETALINFSRMRDNEIRSQDIIVKEPVKVRIYALGEGRDGEMFDYGWIVDVKTHKEIWEMKYRETMPAGSDSKNRMFEGSITLQPGHYSVGYQTDDSHAYRSWNSGAPFDKENYGIKIFIEKEAFKKGAVTEYSEKEDRALLVCLIKIGDDERARARFNMPKDGQVQIYAIGEGMNGEMYDYAYIKSLNSGEIVWKMTYSETDHAGGARKNRLFNDSIFLKSGEYEVLYRSDDSHSVDEWNDDPPRDPASWGVTIRLADEK